MDDKIGLLFYTSCIRKWLINVQIAKTRMKNIIQLHGEILAITAGMDLKF